MAGGGFGSVLYGTANIGTVSGTLIAANANRQYLAITNDSDTAVYIRLGTAAAVANEGIRISAGALYEIYSQKGNLWTGAITAISSAASKKCLTVEAVRRTI